MRVSLKELLDRLGVGYELTPYSTCPWSYYDTETGTTCSAEVRMNGDGDEVEAEIQLVYDTPPEGKSPLEQVCWIYCKPITSDKWGPVKMRIRGEDKTNSSAQWEEKGVEFFATCAQELKMNVLPNIDEIMERVFEGRDRPGGGGRGGSSKAPKIKPQQLLGMKQGRGF